MDKSVNQSMKKEAAFHLGPHVYFLILEKKIKTVKGALIHTHADKLAGSYGDLSELKRARKKTGGQTLKRLSRKLCDSQIQ